MINKIYGYLAGAVALGLGAMTLYLRGKSSGKTQEHQERETAVHKQQNTALEVVKENEIEMDRKSDNDVNDKLIAGWVREPNKSPRRD